MEEKLNDEKGELNKKTKEKKAKAAVITLCTIVALFVGLQVYASTNGYGNVFFMIKNLITTGNPAGAQEIFSDKDITLSYKSIKLAEGLKIQVNRLEIKEEQSLLYLNVVNDNGAYEKLPLIYAIDVERPDENGGYIPIMRSIIPDNKITGTTSQDSQYIDIIAIGEKLQGNETITLHITDKNSNDLKTLEINLETREITVTGEEEISKISEIELKKYLSIFSQLNNGSLEEAQLIRMAYDIYDMNFPEKEKRSSLEEINQTIKEFYGNKAIFETVTPPADTRGGEYESLKLPKDCMISPSYQANGYIMDTDMTDYQIGLCLKINDISFENGVYTVKYIYTLYRDAYVEDDEIENQPQYETTIKLKRNEDAKYSKYQVVSIEKGQELKEKVETSIVEESKKQQIEVRTDEINTNVNSNINASFSEEQVKKAISNYLELYANANCGTPLDTLKKNGRINYDSSKSVVNTNNGEVTTNVKFSDYKKAMLNYVTENEFERNWTSKIGLKENSNGYLIHQQLGGGLRVYSINSINKIDDLIYTAKTTSMVENDNSTKSTEDFTFSVKLNNGNCVVDTEVKFEPDNYSEEVEKYELSKSMVDISEIKEVLKKQGKYDILEVESIKKENNKFLIRAKYYTPRVFSEQQYSEMIKNKKIILNNKEYIYEPNTVYGAAYVYVKGEALESGYIVEKVDNGCIFLGGYNNATRGMIKELKRDYAFYVDDSTRIVSIGNINVSNDGVPIDYSVIKYNNENDELYISVDPR